MVTARARYRESSVFWWCHHGGDVAEALQVLHYAALVGGLHAGEAARSGAGLPLQVRGQLIKLSARQASHGALLLLLLLCDDAHPATDRQGCPFVVTLKQKKITLASRSARPRRCHATERTSTPVIMMTLMPACRHIRTALRTSFLGGSNMPTQPTKVRSDWGSR